MCHLSKCGFKLTLKWMWMPMSLSICAGKRQKECSLIASRSCRFFRFHSFCKPIVWFTITSITLQVSNGVINNPRLADFSNSTEKKTHRTSKKKRNKIYPLFGNSLTMCAVIAFMMPARALALSRWKDLSSQRCSTKKRKRDKNNYLLNEQLALCYCASTRTKPISRPRCLLNRFAHWSCGFNKKSTIPMM